MYTETLMLPSISQKHENMFTVQKFYYCHHQKVFICTSYMKCRSHSLHKTICRNYQQIFVAKAIKLIYKKKKFHKQFNKLQATLNDANPDKSDIIIK